MNTLKLGMTLLLFVAYSLQGYSQKKMVLHFKDGSSQTGYVTFKKEEIKFQETLKGNKEKIAYESLDSLSNHVNPRANKKRVPKTMYVYPTSNENKSYRVYDLVQEGKVDLFKYSSQGGYNAFLIPTGGGASGVYIHTGGGATTVYAAKRSGEQGVTILDSKKALEAYFSDCTTLLEKIENKEKGFTTKDVKKIINFYNSECE